MKKTLLCLSLMCGLSGVAHADIINGKNINPFTGQPLEDRHVALPHNALNPIPDAVNFDKQNQKRDCSPAELLAGKTECNRCDVDVPNVVKPYSPSLAAEMAKHGGMFVYGEDEARKYRANGVHTNGFKPEYYQSFDYRPFTGAKPSNIDTNPKRVFACRKGAFTSSKDCIQEEQPAYIVYRGYNLQGINKDFDPLNNRTVCEMLKPTNDSDKKAGKQGFNGAKIMGLAGLTLGVGGAVGAITDLPIFNPKGAMGAQNAAANALGKAGMPSGLFTATEMFACLEYYTGTNPSMCGGDHVKNNDQGKSGYCKGPLDMYYNTRIQEIWCGYYPCDGDASDGTFKPGTIALRKALLMTNPFYMLGQTATESMRIATQRPMTQQMCGI